MLTRSTSARFPDHRTTAVVFAGFCAFLGLFATQPLLPLFERVFQVSKAAVSLTITGATVGVALAAPFMGTLADRLGQKRVITWSSIGLALATALAAHSGSLNEMIFWRFLQGLFTPGVFAVTVAYIQDEWAEGGAGAATAAYVSGTVLGGFAGRLSAGLLATSFGWRSSFWVLGIAELISALILIVWLPKESKHSPHSGRGWDAAMDHLRNRSLLATYTTGFCVLFCLIASFTYITFYLAAPPFELTTAQLGSIFFVYLAGVILTPIGGRAIDRMGHRRTLSLAITIAAVGTIITLIPHLPAVMAGLSLLCTGTFVSQSAASSYVGLAAKHNRSLAVGLYVSAYYAGGSFGGFLPAYAWRAGGWSACVALIVLVQAITVLLAMAWWADTHVPVAQIEESIAPT